MNFITRKHLSRRTMLRGLGVSVALPLLAKNPMFVLVRGYRAIFLEGHAPVWGSLWKLWIVAAAVFILGHAWFYKLRRSFADII